MFSNLRIALKLVVFLSLKETAGKLGNGGGLLKILIPHSFFFLRHTCGTFFFFLAYVYVSGSICSYRSFIAN